MVRRMLPVLIAVLAASGRLGAGAAVAAPPNDSPAGAGVFTPYTAPNGTPTQFEAKGDLAGSTPDPGVPRCLGPSSFARTVWYRIPEGPVARQLTVEAVGRTTDPIDLAAFVQPLVAPAPTPAPTAIPTATPVRAHAAQATNTREPNACDGEGAGAGADSFDHTSAVSLVVPGGYPVLVQVGRRDTVGSLADEEVLVSLEASDVALAPSPLGDSAASAPSLRRGANPVNLAGATLTGEDPAQPPCPSLGTVWRKLVPGRAGDRLISVTGRAASTMAVFSGSKPTGDNALDCVVRRKSGALQAVVTTKRGQPVWVRVGVDTFVGDEEATVSVNPGTFRTVINGGPGGFDPTPFGPAGGLPAECDTAAAEEATVLGPDLAGRAPDFNRRARVPVRLQISGSPVCDATLRLFGSHGHVVASARFVRLKRGRSRVTLSRLRTFVAGRYHLETTGLDRYGEPTRVDTDVSGRLTRPPRKKQRKRR